MGRREHDPVLRRRAIDLLESGKSVREVAEELGVGSESLRIWVKRAELTRSCNRHRLSSGRSSTADQRSNHLLPIPPGGNNRWDWLGNRADLGSRTTTGEAVQEQLLNLWTPQAHPCR